MIERFCAETMTRGQRKLFALLSANRDAEQRTKLDQLLERREGSPYSTFSWLRMSPGALTREPCSNIPTWVSREFTWLGQRTNQALFRQPLPEISTETSEISGGSTLHFAG